ADADIVPGGALPRARRQHSLVAGTLQPPGDKTPKERSRPPRGGRSKLSVWTRVERERPSWRHHLRRRRGRGDVDERRQERRSRPRDGPGEAIEHTEVRAPGML